MSPDVRKMNVVTSVSFIMGWSASQDGWSSLVIIQAPLEKLYQLSPTKCYAHRGASVSNRIETPHLSLRPLIAVRERIPPTVTRVSETPGLVVTEHPDRRKRSKRMKANPGQS